MDKIEAVCKAIQTKEGWYPPSEKYPSGSISWRCKNPGNILYGDLAKSLGAIDKYTSSLGLTYAVFPSEEAGFYTLKVFIMLGFSGQLKYYEPEMTLKEFFKVYSGGGETYGAFVADKTGIPVDTKVKYIYDKFWDENHPTPKYYRYGHVEGLLVKVGAKVKKSQQIARNGTGNGQWYAHCHFDIMTYKPANWTEYVIGKTKSWVEERYADPRGLEKIVMPTFDHLGYGWLEYATYSSGKAYHSGLDLNGKGSGNDDLNDPIYSACDGEVVYAHSGNDSNSGWGDMIVIKG